MGNSQIRFVADRSLPLFLSSFLFGEQYNYPRAVLCRRKHSASSRFCFRLLVCCTALFPAPRAAAPYARRKHSRSPESFAALDLRVRVALMDLQEMRRSSASSSISAPEPDVPLPDEKKEEAEPSVASLSNAPKAEASNFDAEEKGEPAARTRTHSVNNISSIPNGGLRAWLQVLGSFFLFFNTWLVLSSRNGFSSSLCS